MTNDNFPATAQSSVDTHICLDKLFFLRIYIHQISPLYLSFIVGIHINSFCRKSLNSSIILSSVSPSLEKKPCHLYLFLCYHPSISTNQTTFSIVAIFCLLQNIHCHRIVFLSWVVFFQTFLTIHFLSKPSSFHSCQLSPCWNASWLPKKHLTHTAGIEQTFRLVESWLALMLRGVARPGWLLEVVET